MRIIRFSELQEMPWKNGGGITREIAVARAGEALIWRLSMADVGVDGVFSKFDGLQRILTVIEGRGMELISPFETLQADYSVPVSFDGAWEIQSRLKDGPLRDLNLIYDPTRCTSNAGVIRGDSTVLNATPQQTYAVHCINGEVTLNETERLQTGDTALVEKGLVKLTMAEGDSCLLITLAFPS
jgi:uncharacterized protein